MATAQAILQGKRKQLPLASPSLMPWSCCRRRTVPKQEITELGVPAPECPQGSSPGGSVYQRDQFTGLLRRHVRTSTEELDRFQQEQEARQTPAHGSSRW